MRAKKKTSFTVMIIRAGHQLLAFSQVESVNPARYRQRVLSTLSSLSGLKDQDCWVGHNERARYMKVERRTLFEMTSTALNVNNRCAILV
jgi:hypothetical protein